MLEDSAIYDFDNAFTMQKLLVKHIINDIKNLEIQFSRIMANMSELSNILRNTQQPLPTLKADVDWAHTETRSRASMRPGNR